MSHAHKPPTGSPLHTASNAHQPSAFRQVQSPPPIQLPTAAAAEHARTAQSTAAASNTAAAASAYAAATAQTSAPASPVPSSGRAVSTPTSSTRSPAAPLRTDPFAPPLQQTKALRQQTPTRSSPIIVSPSPQLYSLPPSGSASSAQQQQAHQQSHHTRMLSASSANAILMLQQQQQQQSQQSAVTSARKGSSATAPPTPSPPQSERNSPATLMMSARGESAALLQQQQQSIVPSSALLPSYPLSHSLAVHHPPPQFNTVAPFLYRSGRFHIDSHGCFLRDLHLRSIVYLSHPVEHPLSNSIKQWASEQGIEIANIGATVFANATLEGGGAAAAAAGLWSEQDWHHSVPGSSSASFLALYSELVRLTLEHVLLASNSPVLLMCSNGIELCSLVVGCLRRLQRWTHTSALDEFTRSTSAMQLRDPRSAAGGAPGPGGAGRSAAAAHHHHKSDAGSGGGGIGGGGAISATGANVGGAQSEALWSNGTGCIRYAQVSSSSSHSSDLHRFYRLEELMELFDLRSVRIPTLGPRNRAASAASANASSSVAAASASSNVSLCVEWYRKQRALERREQRAQKQLRLLQQLRNALADEDTSITSAAVANNLQLQPPSEEKPDGAAAPAAAAPAPLFPPQPPLTSWSTDLLSTYRSNRLLSVGLRVDKKATLVDEDED